MIKVLFCIALLSVFIACNKDDSVDDLPKCIVKKIDDIKAGGVWNPPAKVYSYTYNGETVYYFPARCCDIPSSLFDSDCNVICQPDGGFDGEGDGKCSDFFELRTDEKLIWEDTRE